MFLEFFGLKDNPFKLVYDPVYLFMGRPQEEALAHLRYAVDEGEGFTVITGERGVGKSTLCRVFAGDLKASAQVAFIAGPVASAVDLLRRINGRFGIDAEAKSPKDLIDSLNEFLMRARIGGRKVVVFVDDAQALAPQALEQVRLISNLETTRDKLIQLVLIGEPELMVLLGSRALRQMGQRVSVLYAVGGLTEEETAAYIQHRLTRATDGPPLRFDPAVARVVFQHAGGNPRRINLACHALLAAAFTAGHKTIDLGFALTVLREAERQGQPAASPPAAGRRRSRIRALAAAGGALVALTAGVLLLHPSLKRPPVPASDEPTLRPAEPSPPEAASVPAAAPAVTDTPPGAPVAAARPPEEGPSPPAALDGGSQPPMTHSVQVGAFLQPENAQQAVARLTGKGYPAWIVEIRDSSGKTWFSVRIGNHPSRRAALAQADEFMRREQMPAVVRPFEE